MGAKHSNRRNWDARMARRSAPQGFVPYVAAPPARTPLGEDPRFASTFERLQADVQRVQQQITLFTLRPLCLVTQKDEQGNVMWQRTATDKEIAEDTTAFIGPKQLAVAAGFNAARAYAKRLSRYYGLRSRYAAH